MVDLRVEKAREWKSYMRLVVGLLLVGLSASSMSAPSRVTTVVTSARVPLYPPLARAASVQGTVVAEVTTSGEAFGTIRIVSGHPLLSGAVTDNLRTWVLVGAQTVMFSVEYHFRIAKSCKGRPSVEMEFPTKVSICSLPNPPLNAMY
jgi:hypothetical protein